MMASGKLCNFAKSLTQLSQKYNSFVSKSCGSISNVRAFASVEANKQCRQSKNFDELQLLRRYSTKTEVKSIIDGKYSVVSAPHDRPETILLMHVNPRTIYYDRFPFVGAYGWLRHKFTIPSLDPDFRIEYFMRGAAETMEFVSTNLSARNFKALENFVNADALAVIKQNIERMTDEQRKELALDRDNILKSEWDNIKLSANDSGRFIEITAKFHVLDARPGNIVDRSTISGNIDQQTIVCMYRFQRNFTNGLAGDWFINFLTHYRLSELKANMAKDFYDIFSSKD